jgi:hypothetical protein
VAEEEGSSVIFMDQRTAAEFRDFKPFLIEELGNSAYRQLQPVTISETAV